MTLFLILMSTAAFLIISIGIIWQYCDLGQAMEADRRLGVERGREDRARKLLEGYLTRIQRSSLRSYSYFEITGSDGRRYRILHKRAYNVLDITDGEPWVLALCAHPVGDLPVFDWMLGQKLWIETDADAFKKRACSYLQ